MFDRDIAIKLVVVDLENACFGNRDVTRLTAKAQPSHDSLGSLLRHLVVS
jgi:hypothetical protein